MAAPEAEKSKIKEKVPKSSSFNEFLLFLRRVWNNVDVSARLFIRTPSRIFFTIALPVTLILALGAIFSGLEEPSSFNVYFQNHDEGAQIGTQMVNLWEDVLQPMIERLNNSEGEPLIRLNTIPLKDDTGEPINPGEYLEKQKGYFCLVIPENFSQRVYINPPANLTLIMSQESQVAQIVFDIITKTIFYFNSEMFGGEHKICLIQTSIYLEEEIEYYEFFIPGMIAITIMNCGITDTITRFTFFKTSGIFRKFSTSPMKKLDFVLSEALWQFVLAIIIMLISIFTGWAAFGFSWSAFHWMVIPIMLAAVMTFTGLGMIGARFVETSDAATAISSLISYPMMFLSGAFFDVSAISVLKVISKFLPLTYVIDAMRAAMITRNMPVAWINLGISLGVGVIFLSIGVIVTKWADDH